MSEISLGRIVVAFWKAHVFLVDKVKHEGWSYSANYLREHARCASGVVFSNSLSPTILRELRRAHPETKSWINIKPLKQ